MDPQIIQPSQNENQAESNQAAKPSATVEPKNQPTSGQKEKPKPKGGYVLCKPKKEVEDPTKELPFSPPQSLKALHKPFHLNEEDDWNEHYRVPDPSLFYLVSKKPTAPIKKVQYPFKFDRKCITFVGRIGLDPLVTLFYVRNPSMFPYMFKVKCSNNTLFRIEPVSGYINGMCEASITLTYIGTHVPQLNEEYFSIHALAPDPYCMDIREAFKFRCHFETRKKIYVDFAYHDNVDKLFSENPDEMIYARHRRYVNHFVSPAILYRRGSEQNKRDETFGVTPRRKAKTTENRCKTVVNEQEEKEEKEEKEKKEKVSIEKPSVVYEWGNGKAENKNEKNEEDKKKTTDKKKERKGKKEAKKESKQKNGLKEKKNEVNKKTVENKKQEPIVETKKNIDEKKDEEPNVEVKKDTGEVKNQVQNTEAKSEVKTEAKPETRTEAKTEAKTEIKTEAKTEAKTEVKTEAQTETKTEARSEVNKGTEENNGPDKAERNQ